MLPVIVLYVSLAVFQIQNAYLRWNICAGFGADAGASVL